MKIPILCLSLCVWTIAHAEAAEDGHPDALRIVVKPAKTQVRVKETFKVSLRVENATPIVQQIRVMNCSWDQHWKVSNPRISWIRWSCRRNSPVTLDLAPGGAYLRELEMLIPKPVSEKTVTFKMGFTPRDSDKTYWSDDITMEIAP